MRVSKVVIANKQEYLSDAEAYWFLPVAERAQLRFTDINGNRLTAFATNTKGGQLPDLELRHRRRARCEDRIRNA